MKLNIIFLSLLSSMSVSLAQPDIALANKLQRPVYYSIASSTENIFNKNLEVLDPRVGAVGKTLPYDISTTETHVLLSSKPGEIVLFTFPADKPMYVDIKEDKSQNVLLVPQSGTLFSLWRKTQRGYPLSNNVKKDDITKVSFTSHAIPTTNPDAFLKNI